MKKWGLITLCLAVLIILPWRLLTSHRALSDHEAALVAATSSQNDENRTLIPRDTRFVSIHLSKTDRTLLAGEEGTLELEARLKEPLNPGDRVPSWDPNATTPVLVWISSPAKSGIAFIDEYSPARPHQHSLVKFIRQKENRSGPLTATVKYTVNPRTKAGHHTFWMDILAELSFSDGSRVNDLGLASLAFAVDTHLWTKLLMLLMVAVVIFLFVVEWVRVDVVAILMMVLLPELDLLDAQYAFRGLSSNAVVAIIGVMIVSAGLNRTGLVDRVIEPLLGVVGKSASRLVVIFSGVIAGISSVMQNTGAAVLFLPAIRLVTLHRMKIPISRVLMPIGMAAILGGTLTMIGTSPLILLNDILPAGMKKFGFLELTPIGLALVIGGIAYLSTVGMKILAGPTIAQDEAGTDDGRLEKGILGSYEWINGPYEIHVPADYRPTDAPQALVDIRRRLLVNIVASARDEDSCELAPLPHARIEPGAILCAYGPEKAIRKFADDYGFQISEDAQCFRNTLFNPSMSGLVESVVSPRSSLIGQTIKDIRFRETFGVSPLALHRAGKTFYQELADRPLQAGDTVLIHGTFEQFQALKNIHQNLIIITPFEEDFQRPRKAKWAFISFLLALGLMLLSSFYFQNRPYNPIPLSVCLMVGAVGMIITRVMSISEAYHAVDWRTVFLLAGLIPLGMAVDQTGTAQWIAGGIITCLNSIMSPLLLLILLAVMSGAFSLVVSNVGACTLLVPLGVSLATQVGLDPRVAIIVIGLGVSNSFLLPTHQVNVLYMGPGDYSTKDYIKIGGLLSLVYVVILVAMTYFFYLPH